MLEVPLDPELERTLAAIAARVPLDPELERTLAAIAARTGDAPGDLARAALLKYLEDLEDYAVAVEGWRANDPAQNISSEEVLRELGLDG